MPRTHWPTGSPTVPRSPYRWPSRRSIPATPTRPWSKSAQRLPPSPTTQPRVWRHLPRNATRITAGPEPPHASNANRKHAMTPITSKAPTTITANSWPNIIDGRDIVGGGEEVLRDSPAHDIRVASYYNATEAEVDAAVTAAHKAFSTGEWPRTSGAERAALLRRVAARIEAERDELALIETLESGKPISQAKDEVASAAGIWYYAASL